ncbi:MAG: hypothetical protein JXB45_08970 [Candidatus Krumholzibacteriota bacterium]|nr:hypothetical protein [Candidatus Krumholzibacteriota bacterium]
MKRIILGAIFVATIAVFRVCPGAAKIPEKVRKLSPDELTGLLSFTPQRVYYGGYMLAVGDTLEGPVVVIAGALDIQEGGVLLGNIWLVNGELIMNGSGRIEGDVNLVNSKIYLAHDAVVTGERTYYKCECVLDDKKYEQEGIVSFLKHKDPEAVEVKFSLRPGNSARVDYSLIKVGVERKNDRHRKPYVRGQVHLSVPFYQKSHGLIGFDADCCVPLSGRKLELLLRGYKKTISNDGWMLSPIEKAFILNMTGDDFFDYWEVRGGAVGMRYGSSGQFSVSTLLSFQKDLSLEARSLPSILFPRNKYRENPPVDEGERLALSCNLTLDRREEEAWRINSWFCDLWLEKGFADGPGDFSYLAFDLEVRRYNYLSRGLRIDFRAKLFSSFDRIPVQLSRSLNGYGGVRGLSDMPFAVNRGDRMILLSGEFRKSLPEWPVFNKIYSHWQLVIFSDWGLLTKAESERSPLGFLDTPFEEWKKSAGIGFSGDSILPGVGLYMAQDLDRDGFDPRFILRFQRSF